MNIALPSNIDKAAFLAWVQTQERQRYELVDGVVVETGCNTGAHAIVVGNVLTALDKRFERTRWDVIQNFDLETGPATIREPDILVDRSGAGGDLTATDPVLVAEVLAPDSVTKDLGDKPAEYLRIPSLCASLVFSQDKAKAWVWNRGECGFAAAPELYTGEGPVIRLRALSTGLPLSEIYQGMMSKEAAQADGMHPKC